MSTDSTLPAGVQDAAIEIRATALLFEAIANLYSGDTSEITAETRTLLQNTTNALAQIRRDAESAQAALSRLGIEPSKE